MKIDEIVKKYGKNAEAAFHSTDLKTYKLTFKIEANTVAELIEKIKEQISDYYLCNEFENIEFSRFHIMSDRLAFEAVWRSKIELNCVENCIITFNK